MTAKTCGESMSEVSEQKIKTIIQKGIIERLRRSYLEDVFDVFYLYHSGKFVKENVVEFLEQIVPFLYELRQNGRLSKTIENSQKIIVNKVIEELQK